MGEELKEEQNMLSITQKIMILSKENLDNNKDKIIEQIYVLIKTYSQEEKDEENIRQLIKNSENIFSEITRNNDTLISNDSRAHYFVRELEKWARFVKSGTDRSQFKVSIIHEYPQELNNLLSKNIDIIKANEELIKKLDAILKELQKKE